MEGFYKIPSALKILLIELVAMFFFPVTVIGIIAEIHPGLFPDYTAFDGVDEWLMALVGPIFIAWALYDILRPRIKDQVWGIFFKVRFKFCSTHPSYVLVDLLTIAFAAFFLWIGTVGGFPIGSFWAVFATALLFPVVRLSAWYLFGLRINDVETYDAYQPALWAFCIFSAVFGGAALFVVFRW